MHAQDPGPPPPLPELLRRWVAPRPWLRRVVHIAAALAVGVVCIVFAGAADLASGLMALWFGYEPWLALLVLPAALALIVAVTRRYYPEASGSGIPQTIAALQLPEGASRTRLVSTRVAAAKMGLVAFGLLAGVTVGREGPSVQVGAAMMAWLRRIPGLRFGDGVDGLILAGAGAGIASAFNTPLGGIVFVLEELSRHRPFRAHGPTLVAVIGAGLASVLLVGKYAYFGVVHTELPWPNAWLAVGAIGLAGGLAGGLFARVCSAADLHLPARLTAGLTRHPVASAAACGLVLAFLAILTHGATMGTGYAQTKALIDGSEVPGLWYVPARLAATFVCVIVGLPGGLFAPSLAVGAGIGASLHALSPHVPVASLVILGMVGYLAAVTQSPITAFVITMEMTANQDLLLPMMAVSVVAYGVSRTLCHVPLYDALALRWMGGRRGPPGAP